MRHDSVHIEPMTGHLMVPEAYIAAAVALFCIGFVGFFSNLLVIILMCREKKLWTPLNVILFNLVLSDFSVSILGNPFTLASSVARRWLFGRLMCVVYGFFMSLLGISSITTLTVLSFERYIIISRPFKRNHLSHKGALMMVLGIWAYALALTTPPLFGWGDYVNEAANISCSVNWETKSYNATTYILFLFALGLVVPVVVICFSYINIIRTMKRNMIAMGRVTKAESRVAFMVAIMIVAFFVAWTPYAFLALLVHFGNSEVSPGYAVVPALVAKSSICYNPVIYVGLNTQFRSAWKRLLGVHSSGDNSCEVVATTEGNVNHATNPSQSVQDDAAAQPKSKSITNIITNYKRKPKKKSVLVIVSKQKDNTTVSQIYSATESPFVPNKNKILFKNKNLKKSKNINDSCDLVEFRQKPNDNEKEDITQHSV